MVFGWVASNWERVLFSCFGLIFFAFAISYMKDSSLPASSAAFGMGFLCFVFSSVARFKRFKGLGFEAELWEDKQKEAAELIDRLKDIVAIYSREVVLTRVTQGRWGSGRGAWAEHWALFDELTKQHDALGQKIDFSKLKSDVDVYFVFDMALRLIDGINRPIKDGIQQAQAMISREFGSPIQDIDGYNKRIGQLREVQTDLKDPFEVAERENLAEVILSWARETERSLKKNFGIKISFDPDTLAKLAEVSEAYASRPVRVTERLISLSNGD